MSEKKNFIELSAPKLMFDGPVREVYHSGPYVCPRCGGKGWNWGCDLSTGEFIEVPCECCGGSGEVEAIVSIEWRGLRG